MIETGKKVTWISSYKRKKGTVLAFCPAWENPCDALERTRGVALLPNERSVDGMPASKNDRYLVAVPRGGKSKLVDIYTPYVSLVKEVSPL